MREWVPNSRQFNCNRAMRATVAHAIQLYANETSIFLPSNWIKNMFVQMVCIAMM